MTHDYNEIFEKNDAAMLEDADKAITECGLWEWLRDYVPDEDKGFMFSDHPNLKKIDSAMKYGGHSASSYGWTMRQMEFIAKNGWDTFRADVLKNTDLKKLAREKYRASADYKAYSAYLEVCLSEERGGIVRAMLRQEEEVFKRLLAIKKTPPIAQAITNLGTVLQNVKTANPSPLDLAEASRGVPGYEGEYERMKDYFDGKFKDACPCHREKGLTGWCGVAGGGVPGCCH